MTRNEFPPQKMHRQSHRHGQPTVLEQDHARIRQDATRFAGRPQDLIQRAAVYLHLYRHSRGNHTFPLLAAHGALWGAGHFQKGILLARALTALQGAGRARKMQAVQVFATAFKDINRRVCIETYTMYHLTARHGDDPDLERVMPRNLISAMTACHRARRAGLDASTEEKRALFDAFFLWEQDTIVGPSVAQATADFDWPLMRWLAMKPAIGFRYFSPLQRLWFRSFDDTGERIARGRTAFDIAAKTGWDRVEKRLDAYGILPFDVRQDPRSAYQRVSGISHCQPCFQ